MLARFLGFAVFAALAATQLPVLVQAVLPQDEAAPGASAASVEPATATSGGAVQLRADAAGHYNGNFRFNGKTVQGLIDTGATTIAINESTARRLGFGANKLDFAYAVNTANGQTQAARVMLDRVEIGSVRVRKVDAMVLRDEALSGTLVGMSFLKKLGSYRVEKGRLELRQ